MNRIIPTEVRVLYRNLGRVHVFTSPDLPGLHHAHMDLQTAFNTLPNVVGELVELQFGAHEHYTLDRDFTAFKAFIESVGSDPFIKLSAEGAMQHA